MEDKLLQLEIKISYLEDYVSQMNSIMIEQGTKIDRLIQVNKNLQEKMTLLEENIKEPTDNIPPPHY